MQIFAPAGSRNRDNIASARKHPRQSELTGCTVLFARNVINAIDDFQILLKILPLKPWMISPIVIGSQIFGLFYLAGQKAAAQGAIGHKGDSQLSAYIQHPIFRIARPQGILALQSGDSMNFRGAANGFAARFG